MEPSRFEVFKQASKIATSPPSPQDILTAVLITILFIVVFIVVPFLIYRRYKVYVAKKSFFRIASENYQLTPEEIEFLWKLSREFKVDPELLLTSYAAFQRAVFRYIRKYGSKDIKIISSIRSKLGFTKLPEFVPLSSTMDIDIYQPVTVIVNDESFDAAVYDNNEKEWVISFLKKAPINLKPGDEVVVSFIRQNDGRYIIPTRVISIKKDKSGSVFAKLEHTDKFEKIQLRAYVRWPVHIPCKFAPLPFRHISDLDDIEKIRTKLKFYEGIIEDISAGGIRLCVNNVVPELYKIRESDYILVSFNLNGETFDDLLCEVVRTITTPFSKGICYGCAFVDLPKEYQQKIQQFIWDEQRKIIKLYKEGGI